MFLLEGLLPKTYMVLLSGEEDFRGDDYCLFNGEQLFSLHLLFLFEENSPFFPLFFIEPFLGEGDL
jgi:hypothetical protein